MFYLRDSKKIHIFAVQIFEAIHNKDYSVVKTCKAAGFCRFLFSSNYHLISCFSNADYSPQR
jgi:hypothetical protein